MKKLKKYIILSSILLIIISILSLIYLFSNISYNLISSILIIIYFIFFIILSFLITKNRKSKGIVSGLKIGLISILIMLVLSFIFKNQLSIKTILYYIIILFSNLVGAILSKNIKR